MKRLYYHPESDSYFWEDQSEFESSWGMDAMLCIDVTDELEHREKAIKRGIKEEE